MEEFQNEFDFLRCQIESRYQIAEDTNKHNLVM